MQQFTVPEAMCEISIHAPKTKKDNKNNIHCYFKAVRCFKAAEEQVKTSIPCSFEAMQCFVVAVEQVEES